MHKYRKEFSEVLSSSNSNLTKSRFMRLFWLSILLILVVLPVQYYVLVVNVSHPFVKYSWNEVHADWGNISSIPTNGAVIFDVWIQIAVGFAVFFFFGLGQDARNMYSKWLLKIGLGRVFPSLGRRSHPEQPAHSSSTSSTRALFSKRWSRSSFLSL